MSVRGLGRVIVGVMMLSGCVAADSAIPAASARLVNPAFDAGTALDGWVTRGEQYARAEVIDDPVVSPPHALRLSARGPGSSGDKAFMIYQVLDVAPYRGRRVHFGAKVWTKGGASNITLYTPQKFANDFFTELDSGRYAAREAVLDVPNNASFLSLGIQVFGKAGASVLVDDVFVTVEGSADAPPVVSRQREPGRQPSPAPADVRIDATRIERTLSPYIFGMHIEWVASGNGLVDPATGRLRDDVMRDLRPLRIPLFRFPGGIHADYYDWGPAAEPRGRRPQALNVFTGKAEAQLFGIPELGALLEATGAAALITANYGTGSPERAGAWAAYMARAGMPAPLWEVGNEIYLADPGGSQPNGKKIYRRPEQYAADFDRYRSAIRAAIPDARVGAIAHLDSGAFPLAPAATAEWSSVMLRALRTPKDFIAVHNAYAPVIIDDSIDFTRESERARVYRAMYASVRQTQRNLEEVRRLAGGDGAPPLAVTEFGPLFGVSRKQAVHTAYVDQSRTMAAAVYVASLLDAFIGDGKVFAACYTNVIHKWYGSLVTDTEAGLVKTPTYYLYDFYRNRFESGLVAASVSGPSFDSTTVGIARAETGVPALVARAGLSPDRSRLTAILVNRSLDQSLATTVTVKGFRPGRTNCQAISAATPNGINGTSLTATTAAGTPIVPAAVPCPAGPSIPITVPPNAIISLVAEKS